MLLTLATAVWVLAATATAMLPMQRQFAPGITATRLSGTDGTLLWQTSLPWYAVMSAVAVSGEVAVLGGAGGVLAAPRRSQPTPPIATAFLAQLDTRDGGVLWQRTYGPPSTAGAVTPAGLLIGDEGDIYLAGAVGGQRLGNGHDRVRWLLSVDSDRSEIISCENSQCCCLLF